MRSLDACTEEVFRRSSEKIKKRKAIRNRVLALCIPMCLVLTCLLFVKPPALPPEEESYDPGTDQINPTTEPETTTKPDSVSPELDRPIGDEGLPETEDSISPIYGSADTFSFSLTWGCYGVSSYDSATGKLVKTTDATNPEDYITTYQLTAEQKQQIFQLIKNLNVQSYPDNYDPHPDGVASDPPMTLILQVDFGTFQKTISARDIAITFVSEDEAGQKFLDVCKAIQDVLKQTEEWKALPDYENLYE